MATLQVVYHPNESHSLIKDRRKSVHNFSWNDQRNVFRRVSTNWPHLLVIVKQPSKKMARRQEYTIFQGWPTDTWKDAQQYRKGNENQNHNEIFPHICQNAIIKKITYCENEVIHYLTHGMCSQIFQNIGFTFAHLLCTGLSKLKFCLQG